MSKSITIASIAYDVYDTTISSKTSRLKAVTDALKAACDDHYDDQKYLIFTGPEYMFARKNYTRSTVPSGFEKIDPKYGADGTTEMEEELGVRVKVGYSQGEKDDIISALKAASKGKPRLLVLPGTILWREYLYFKNLFNRVAKMYNTLPIIHDGNVIHTYHKKSESSEISADFRLRRERLAEKKYHNYQSRKYKFQAGAASNKFSVWGLKMGVEICADHNTGILKNELSAGEKLDFQFLISASQSVQSGSIAVSNGGVLVHTDGSVGKSAQTVSVGSVNASTKIRTMTDATEGSTINGNVRVWQFDHG